MSRSWPPVQFLLNASVMLLALFSSFTAYTRTEDAAKCFQRLDIILAVDTATSENAEEFEKLKPIVKQFASYFKISQTMTRIALISYAMDARMHLDLADTVTVSDFNNAVDRLKYTGGRSQLAPAMRMAKVNMLTKRRMKNTEAVIVMVMDARYEDVVDRYLDPSMIELDWTSREAFDIKMLRVGYHLVAVGSPWHRLGLNKAQGFNSRLSIGFPKALEVVQSLHNKACVVCKNRKGNSYRGPCLDGMRHVWTSTVVDDRASRSREYCKIKIARKIEGCSAKGQSCSKVERTIGTCEKNRHKRALVESSWKYFDKRLQRCHTQKVIDYLHCDKTSTCANDVAADVIIMLDKTRASQGHFDTLKEAAKAIINYFDVGTPSRKIKIAVFTFQSADASVHPVLKLGDKKTKAEMLAAIDNIPGVSGDYGSARDQFNAVRYAMNHFRVGYRPKNHKNNHIILITTGPNNQAGPGVHLYSRALVEEFVTTYVIAVGNVDKYVIRDITAPESDSNAFFIPNFSTLVSTARKLAGVLCVQMDEPHGRLCDEKIVLQQFSQCNVTGKTQNRFDITYKLDSSNRCYKQRAIEVMKKCKKIITNPYSGFEYRQYDKKILCHKFDINPKFPVSPMFVKETTIKQCLNKDYGCVDAVSTLACRDDYGVINNGCKCLNEGGAAVLEIKPS